MHYKCDEQEHKEIKAKHPAPFEDTRKERARGIPKTTANVVALTSQP